MKKLLTTLFLGACCAYTVHAQEEDVLRPRGKSAAEMAAEGRTDSQTSGRPARFYFGGETGLNYNMFSQTVERSGAMENSIEDVLQTGDGISRFISLFVDFPLTSSLGLQIKGAIDQKAWSNSGRGGIDIFDDVDGSYRETATMEANYDAVANYVGLALLLRADIGNTGFFISAGPTYYVLVGDVERTDKVTVVEGSPTSHITVNYELEPGQHNEISRTTTEPLMLMPSVGASNLASGEYSTSRLGIEAGLGYKLVLTPEWQLWPQVRYNYSISTLATETKMTDFWMPQTQGTPETTYKDPRINSIQASLSLVYQF